MATPRKENPQKGGRPSTFTVKIGQDICKRIAAGETLTGICEDDDMPPVQTVRHWLWADQNPEFSKAYRSAREAQMDAWTDEILKISDDGHNDWMEKQYGETTAWVTNGEALARSRLRVDTRKFLMAKIAPKRYGEKLAVVGPNGGAIQTEVTEKQVIDFSTLPAAARAALRAALEAEDE